MSSSGRGTGGAGGSGQEISAAREAITRLERRCPDFPRPGVEFVDLTPVLADGPAFRAVISGLCAGHRDGDVDMVAGLDARGFLLAAAVALELGTGVLAIRKAGKLPPPVVSRAYTLEYGDATLEVPGDGLDLAGRRVLVVDDVLATGGTLEASVELLRACGAEVVGLSVVLELEALGGRARLADTALTSLALG